MDDCQRSTPFSVDSRVRRRIRPAKCLAAFVGAVFFAPSALAGDPVGNWTVSQKATGIDTCNSHEVIDAESVWNFARNAEAISATNGKLIVRGTVDPENADHLRLTARLAPPPSPSGPDAAKKAKSKKGAPEVVQEIIYDLELHERTLKGKGYVVDARGPCLIVVDVKGKRQ